MFLTTDLASAKYIGRVGALAIALGIGGMVAVTPAVASADDSSPESPSESSSSSESSPSGAKATDTTGDRTATQTIIYTGNQLYRDFPFTFMYTHTLPPNWNARAAGNQRWNCGSTNYSQAHIAASSYHPGGVVLVFADASTRFVNDSVDLAVWQAVGSRAGGETLGLE